MIDGRLDIPSPAEVAKANRVKDEARRLLLEAADDELAEVWIQRATEYLIKTYRGAPIEVHLYWVSGRRPHYPDRFGLSVIRRFHDTGWTCEYIKTDNPDKNDGYGEIRFSGQQGEPSTKPSRRTLRSILGGNP